MDKLTLETQIENARYHLVRTLAEDNIPEIQRATDALNQVRERYERLKADEQIEEKPESVCSHYYDCDFGTYQLCCKDYIKNTCKYLDRYFVKEEL